MQKAAERLNIILRKAEISSEISPNDFSNLEIVKKLNRRRFSFLNSRSFKFSAFVVILSYILYGESLFNSSQCFLEMPPDASKIFREPENCDICANVTRIKKVANVSALEFSEKYAKTATPLVVSDGATKWPAMRFFCFDFFKELYETIDSDTISKSTCQFFRYKTEFTSLEEVFQMTTERAKLAPGEKPWYIGWSNCNDEAGKILQKYYEKPYFLSNNSENIALSWIFMGGPGYGAHMHVDNVHYPSWQAQLSGRKLWRLAPPPECLYKCKTVQVVVEPGEIIVVDTNRWYHQTIILPGEISITIGSEYD